MNFSETVLPIICRDNRLVGIMAAPSVAGQRGLVILVGGPQYRVGSHRQFVHLARTLAGAGIAVLRFDYRGMGDSEGEPRAFDDADDDIRAAIDAFILAAGLKDVVLWGLCDAASAALLYAPCDHRVAGVAVVNPWVRTESGMARTIVRHYYGKRLMEKEFWQKLFAGNLGVRASLKTFAANVAGMFAGGTSTPEADNAPKPLPDRMAAALEKFTGPLLCILSGQDLVAREFEMVCHDSARWQKMWGQARVRLHRIEAANHTFARSLWRDEVAHATLKWLRAW